MYRIATRRNAEKRAVNTGGNVQPDSSASLEPRNTVATSSARALPQVAQPTMWDFFVNRIKRLFVGTYRRIFRNPLPRLFSSISKRNVRGTKENGYKAVDGSFPLKDPPRW